MSSSTSSPRSVMKAALGAGDHSRAADLVTMLRLHWFIRLRWIFLLVAVVILVVERHLVFAHVQRSLLGLSIVLASLAIVNLGWMYFSYMIFQRFREESTNEPKRYVELFANAQVAVDLLLLTFILRFTGGAENPMVIFYLFHMAIVALLLRRWQAIMMGFWALGLYSIMVILEWCGWLAGHYPFLPQCPVNLYIETEYVFSSILVLACGIFGTLYFTLQVANRLKKREQALCQVNQALQKSQIAIQDLQARRSRFMQTAAHQLKSPLAVIQTLTELIRGKIVPLEVVPETCDKIVSRCKDGISQVTELLTLARVQEADPARHQQSESDVLATVQKLCERFCPVAAEKSVALKCVIPETGEWRVNIDQQDLGDCLGNLIENAIKYTPAPGNVEVTLGANADSREIFVTVSDTGIGINPEILVSEDGTPGHAPVFDAFRRGNNALTAGIPGTGLGLSIVREILEQAGGRIRVSSRPNEGSTFTVTLPSYEADQGRPRVRDTRAGEIVLNDGAADGGDASISGHPATG